jgi:hypothetical protein
LGVALLAGALGAPVARADYVYNLTQCFATGCPAQASYGTVTVSSIAGSTTEVQVDVELAAGEVFAFGGAGKPLLFDLSGTPGATSSPLPSGFTFNNAPMTMADGTGKWDYYVDCPGCTGTSNTSIGGSLIFDVIVASGISPDSFIQNKKNLYFATDIGIPSGGGNYVTGDVGASSRTVVPLPDPALLLASALGLLGLLLTRRRFPLARAAFA